MSPPRQGLPPSVLMALGLTGCGLVSPCLEPVPCLSVVDPCSTPNPPPDCFTPCLSVPVRPDPTTTVDKLQPSVCLSVMPCLEPVPPEPGPQPVDCAATPDHPDCPPPDEVKKEVLEKEVLPEDVQQRLKE